MQARKSKNLEGVLSRREQKLAFFLLSPTFLLVIGIVLFPLFANFWISFKPISLADLRPPTILVKERIKGNLEQPGEPIKIEYRFRNSSMKYPLSDVVFNDQLPKSVEVVEINQKCLIEELSDVKFLRCV